MRVRAENLEDGRAGAGDLARLPAQPLGQRGHFQFFVGMFVDPGFHLVAKNYTGIRQKQAVNCKVFAISSLKKAVR